MSYQAIVCKIQTRPHPNADKLVLGTVHGYQVVVGLDTNEGDLGVFFPTDGQLSPEMCEANDLIGYKDEATGERRGGFFGKNRRVRSQKFRGEKSDGYWTPLTALEFTGANLSELKEGDQFGELNGVAVCNKYFTPATLKAQQAGKGKARRENDLFAKHVDTLQFRNEVDRLPADSIIYLTEKVHGTSGRVGLVKEAVNLPTPKWKRPFAKVFKIKNKTREEHVPLLGTRNTILADHTVEGFYGSEEFRWNAVEKIVPNLHKGEIIYFELAGFTTTGQPIMAQPSTKELKDIKKKYGEQMTFSYGQAPGTCGLHVYRITRVNEDGNAVELPWTQVKARCRELGINHVPEFHGAYQLSADEPLTNRMPPFEGFDTEWLKYEVADLMEGPSLLDESHIREGVVVRAELPDGSTTFLKSKSFTFGVLEGYLKTADDYVDTEEVS